MPLPGLPIKQRAKIVTAYCAVLQDVCAKSKDEKIQAAAMVTLVRLVTNFSDHETSEATSSLAVQPLAAALDTLKKRFDVETPFATPMLQELHARLGAHGPADKTLQHFSAAGRAAMATNSRNAMINVAFAYAHQQAKRGRWREAERLVGDLARATAEVDRLMFGMTDDARVFGEVFAIAVRFATDMGQTGAIERWAAHVRRGDNDSKRKHPDQVAFVLAEALVNADALSSPQSIEAVRDGVRALKSRMRDEGLTPCLALAFALLDRHPAVFKQCAPVLLEALGHWVKQFNTTFDGVDLHARAKLRVAIRATLPGAKGLPEDQAAALAML